MYGYSSSGEQARPLTPNQVGRLRDYIRDNVIRDILTEVDQLVVQLLSASSRGGSILDFLA
jgi:hypothetical protein